MNYITNTASANIDSIHTSDICPENTLLLPGYLGFKQLELPKIVDNPRAHNKSNNHNEPCILIEGCLAGPEDVKICPECGATMYGNGYTTALLKELPYNNMPTLLSVRVRRHHCPFCRCDLQEHPDFRAECHLITCKLYRYAEELLAKDVPLKEVCYITKLGPNVVKDIDKKRLERLYTVNGGGKKLILPETQATKLGVDEFLLHEGRKFATIIIDLDTGHVLWLSHGKKKQCVYDFIDHVGKEWMRGVQCVASDMNSDFVEAFQDRCPWVKVVYDHFHLVNNLNDKVISEVRKDEQKRLIAEGRLEEAKRLKGSKYILMTNKETRVASDTTPASDSQRKPRRKSNDKPEHIFNEAQPPKPKPKPDQEKRYQEIIKDNEMLMTCDLVKEKLRDAYLTTSEDEMREKIDDIIVTCRSTDNKHMIGFANLLENHKEGIINHAVFRVSTGKVEGTNAMIKALRRKHYGIPDDDYFFLKIFDASRQKSHNNN